MMGCGFRKIRAELNKLGHKKRPLAVVRQWSCVLLYVAVRHGYVMIIDLGQRSLRES